MTPVALITGASRGLGRALARELAQRGWQLILDARNHDALAIVREELAPLTTVVAIAGDIAEPSHQRELAEVAQQLGGLNAVIHNASTLGPSPRPDLLDLTPADFQQILLVNLVAPLSLTQLIWPALASDAAIIAITSDAGSEAYAGWGGYGTSKAALNQLFAILAAEHPDRRVYVVDPGDMNTQMHQEAFPGEDISDRPEPEESVPGIIALIEGPAASGRYQARAVSTAEVAP